MSCSAAWLRWARSSRRRAVASSKTAPLANVSTWPTSTRLRRLLDRVRPDVVVNAAAYTAVDRAEDDADTAFRANAEGPGRLAAECATRDIALVHYSTDYVFDGQGSRPYREDDATAPIGVYGHSKLAGEQAIAASGARHLILRTAWVYGLHGANFLRTMLRVGAERDELRVVADQRGTPTPAWLIADVTADLLRGGLSGSGVLHLVADGETTWHGFAEAIFEEAVSARSGRTRTCGDGDHNQRLSDACPSPGLFGARYGPPAPGTWRRGAAVARRAAKDPRRRQGVIHSVWSPAPGIG